MDSILLNHTMKKLLTTLFLFCFCLIGLAQTDYTSKVVQGGTPTYSGTLKMYIFTPSDENLTLPTPTSVGSNKLIAIQTKDLYTSYVRLNMNVNYVSGALQINYLPRYISPSDSAAKLYLYCDGTAYNLYYDYQLPSNYSSLASAITTVTTQFTDASLSTTDFGKRIKLVTDGIAFNLPAPTTVTPYQSFTIINQGSQNVILNYPFHTDKTTRTSILPNSGSNIYEIFSDGTVYRAIKGN